MLSPQRVENAPKKGGDAMQIPRDAVLLRIFFGENDRFGQKPL